MMGIDIGGEWSGVVVSESFQFFCVCLCTNIETTNYGQSLGEDSK